MRPGLLICGLAASSAARETPFCLAMADSVSPCWTVWLFCGVFAATLLLELTAETLIGLLGIRGSEAELPPGLELPRISALAYGAGHTGRDLDRKSTRLNSSHECA